MMCYRDKSWCECSPGGEHVPCGNGECDRWLSPLELEKAVRSRIPIAYGRFKDTEFCAGFIKLVEVDVHV